MNVIRAFLYGFLDEIIYIEQPHLFEINANKVCKLLKALYRLKQASHVWYKMFINFFQKLSFQHLGFNHFVFVLEDK